MKTLITGASGHLGANLVRAALGEGWEVRALVRPSSNRAGLDQLDIEVVEGDLLDPDSLARACDGVELVLHAAAVHRNWVPDPATLLEPTVRGTEHLLAAAQAAGVRRVVLTSSNATVGYPPDQTPWDESHHLRDANSTYIRSKCLQEARALELGAELGIEVVVCNPCGILGPWDFKPTPTTRSVIEMAAGGPVVLDVALTHVEDVASGHILAATNGEPGRRYLLSGDNCTKERGAELMSELCGRKVKAMRPPRFLMRLVAWNEVRKARKSGGDAGITGDQIADVFGRTLFYDSTRAREELGWTARPARAVLLDALAWLAVRHQLPDDVAERVLEQRPADPAWPTA